MRTFRARLANSWATAGRLDSAIRGVDDLQLEVFPQLSSNTNVKVSSPRDGSAAVLKLVRRHDPELAPGTPSRALDVWKGAFLTDETSFRNTPGVFGSIDHVGAEGMPRTVATLTEYASHGGDSWSHALAQVGDVLGTARASDARHPSVVAGLDSYAATARNHGRRLGELHTALASGGAGSEFRAVAASPELDAGRPDELLAGARRAFTQLRDAGAQLPGGTPLDDVERAVASRIDEVTKQLPHEGRPDQIHTHGDFHLGQMLDTKGDVMIVDLEGAPTVPIAQRWLRTDALGDVARQRSSYEYAAETGLRGLVEAGATPAELAAARPVAGQWAAGAREAFVDGWREATVGQSFVPRDTDLPVALREADLRNVFHETSYELNSRPDWVSIPAARLERLAAG